MTFRFTGSAPALVTPFAAGTVDEGALEALVEWQIEQGSHGLVPCGTTGESPTLSHEEHERVAEICIRVARGRVPVIAGAGSNNTAEAISLARHAERSGAAAVLAVTPYYNRPSQEGLFRHFEALNDALGIPIIIYNIPPRSVVDMSIETMQRLYELKNIAGVKDATANLARVSLQRHALGPDFVQLSGEDMTALAYLAAGGHGGAGARRYAAGGGARRRLPDGARDPGPARAAACRDVRRAEPGRAEIRAVAARPHR